MAENAFTKYKDYLPSDYLRDELATADQQYMLDQESKSKMFGYPDKRFVPNQRETDTSKLQSAFSYLGLSPEKSLNYARDFTGRPEIESIGRSLGVADLTGYGPLAYDLPQNIKDFKKAREEGSVGGQAMSAGFGLLNLAEVIPIAGLGFKAFNKPIKGFAKSISEKLNNIDTTPQLGALPSNKVIANTAKKQPSMAMTDPKVVDEFGFYSEAERQAKMIQQNKGSGAQFQGMLLNKGVKKDEIVALGLDELFKKPNVTKKEIVDTIELNKVQLIETKKTKTKSDSPDADNLFDMENFTDISKEDGSFFTTLDEINDAYDTGKYKRRTVTYDGIVDGVEMPLSGTVNTHLPTGYRTIEIGSVDDDADQFVYDIHLTFKPDADVSDWRNSVEAQDYVNEVNETGGSMGLQDTGGAETKNLQLEDFDNIIANGTATSYDEAIVRLQSAATNSGDYDPGSYVRWEGSTQPGGTNYKELLLRLPPKGGRKDYNKPIDFQYTTHWDEFNPLFHIRTKDRTTPDGKKVLYVEELQSDWGQSGSGKGFKLEGEDLEKAKKEFQDVKQEILDLKNGGVKLDGYEQEALYKLAYPNRPPIRIPFTEPKDFRAKHDFSPTKYYDTVGNVKDYDFDYSQSRMPKELRTMTFGQYMNFYEVMGRVSKGEINDRSIEYVKESILNPQDAINKFYDSKDADYLFGQINQPSFNADGNKFMKDLSKKYLQKSNNIQGRVPVAPFVTDRNKWTGLAIKRLIKLADEGGYDHIAFSPGQVQYDRWGKEFLKEYYDEIVPNVAKDVTRKMSDKSANMKTTTKDLEVVIDNNFQNNVVDPTYNQKTFAINVTPKMRETIKGGMPLFSTVGGMLGVGATISNQDIGGLGSLPNDQT